MGRAVAPALAAVGTADESVYMQRPRGMTSWLAVAGFVSVLGALVLLVVAAVSEVSVVPGALLLTVGSAMSVVATLRRKGGRRQPLS